MHAPKDLRNSPQIETSALVGIDLRHAPQIQTSTLVRIDLCNAPRIEPYALVRIETSAFVRINTFELLRVETAALVRIETFALVRVETAALVRVDSFPLGRVETSALVRVGTSPRFEPRSSRVGECFGRCENGLHGLPNILEGVSNEFDVSSVAEWRLMRFEFARIRRLVIMLSDSQAVLSSSPSENAEENADSIQFLIFLSVRWFLCMVIYG